MSEKTKSMLRLAIAAMMLLGLLFTAYYTWLGIIHDMRLITSSQKDVFEVFSRRAPVLDPLQLRQFIEGRLNEAPSADPAPNQLTHAYAYDLSDRHKLNAFPLSDASDPVLATYHYALSYPEVINIYVIFDDQRLFGMMSNFLTPPHMLPSEPAELSAFKPWAHYFGCAAFATTHELCSGDKRLLSDIKSATFTRQKTITLYFPFVYPQQAGQGYRYGLQAIDIAVDEAFREVLQPFDSLNPTRAVLSFDAAEPCRPWHLCLSKALMHADTERPLYLKWSYSYPDFLKAVLYGTPFTVYVITVLVLLLLGPQIYQFLLGHTQTDRLTRLPRRDLLDEIMLRKYDYLLLLDIDNFKTINDTHGHHVGDMALAAFARHLESSTRRLDIALRWGGEEFVILYQGVDEESIRQSVARLLAQPLWLPELPAPITFSAGLIQLRDYFKVEDAISLADELLYHAKQHGKHNIAYYREQQIRLIREQQGADTPSPLAVANGH